MPLEPYGGMGGTTIATTVPDTALALAGAAARRGDGLCAGSKGDAMWQALGHQLLVDPKEGLVGILMSQAPSKRIDTRMLMKNLIYGAMMN